MLLSGDEMRMLAAMEDGFRALGIQKKNKVVISQSVVVRDALAVKAVIRPDKDIDVVMDQIIKAGSVRNG